ncbi:MAG: SDR family NAD(P)-dependent oxidoreductase [Bacteroidota bacterium]
MELKGKTAIVTGGTGELGKIVVRRFVREEMNVVVTARGMESVPPGVEMIAADVTVEKDVLELFKATVSKHGSVDVLVNTVGGFLPEKNVADVSLDEWQHMMSINLLSAFLCTREGVRAMRGRKFGRIINISAYNGIQPAPGKAPYSIAKAGVALLSELVAREVKGTGITVNAIAPSIIVTEANKSSMPKADITRWVTPEEITEAICYLCSESGGAINGTTLKLFGGL